MKTIKAHKTYKIAWTLTILTFSYLLACSQGNSPRENEDSTDKTLSPYFVVISDNGKTEQLPLKSTQVDVNIAGVIADVNIKQVYTNTGKNAIEAIYIFPASTRAAVYNMVMTINDREIIAIVEEKGKARNLYETAKQEGKTASLLEEQRPNVFQMNIANIMPGNTIEVSLSYTELLVPTDKVYEFIYPTVVGPRYVSANEIENNSTEAWTKNPYLEEKLKPTSSLSISLKLSAGIPIKELVCSTHKNDIKFLDKTTATVELKEPNGGNRDFVTRYRLAGNEIESGILLYDDPNGERYFLAMMQAPKKVEPGNIPPREYVFIVDISGSMSGFPLDVSKNLMKSLLGNLKETDKFNIVFFAGGSSVYAEKSLSATSKNISEAINFLENQRGGGGTELLNALQTAMTLNMDDNYSRSFLILTDGYVSIEKETFDLIRENLGTANFFSFGIGSSVNRYLIEGMAHVGYGEPFIALNHQDAQKQAKKFEQYISQPVLTNIKIEFNDFNAYDVLPEKTPDLFADRPLIISGKYNGMPGGNIHIKGQSGNRPFSKTLVVNENSSASKKALKYLWAREKVRLLSDYNNLNKDNDTRNDIIKLGIKYNLLTEYTSFIAIDSDISNPTNTLNTVTQPIPFPAQVNSLSVACVKSYASVTRSKPAKKDAIGYSEIAVEKISLELIDTEEETPYIIVEEMPKFQGGDIKSFQNYVQSKLIYPEKAKEHGLFGRVFIQFNVDINGEITDIKIVRSVDALLDNEALRVIQEAPNWTPGKQNGKTVTVSFTIPITFKLTN